MGVFNFEMVGLKMKIFCTLAISYQNKNNNQFNAKWGPTWKICMVQAGSLGLWLFSRSQFLWLFQGLNSYDFLQKCQTPLAVTFVLSTPTKGWSNTGCPMDVDHASLLYILFEDQIIVFAKSFFRSTFSQPSIVFQYYFSWLVSNSNIAHISPHRHLSSRCTF